jgi:hypothetical protein
METGLHLLFDPDQLVAETLFNISSLHGKDWLESVLFAAQDLHFFLVVVEFIGDALDLLLRYSPLTSSVCSLPFSEAGFEPKLFPVSFINKYMPEKFQIPIHL